MPGITVEIRSDPGKPPVKVVTDETGAYILSGLAPGVYELSTQLSGFEGSFRGIDLKAPANLDFVMRVQSVATCVCISPATQPVTPLPLPQDSFRKAEGEQAALHLWQYSIQLEDETIPQQVDAQQQELINEFRLLGVDGLPFLTPLLKNANPRVRERAVIVLGALGPDARQALPYLQELFYRNSTAFERSVTQAIEHIGG